MEQLRQLPKPEISFNYLGQFDQVVASSGLFRMATNQRGSHFSNEAVREHLIDITGAVTDGQLHLTWMYNETIHDRNTIEAVAQDYMKALQEIIDHCAERKHLVIHHQISPWLIWDRKIWIGISLRILRLKKCLPCHRCSMGCCSIPCMQRKAETMLFN